jgi:hypothetical protein
MASTPKGSWSDIAYVNHEKAWVVLCRLEREQLLVLFSRTLRVVPAVKRSKAPTAWVISATFPPRSTAERGPAPVHPSYR